MIGAIFFFILLENKFNFQEVIEIFSNNSNSKNDIQLLILYLFWVVEISDFLRWIE